MRSRSTSVSSQGHVFLVGFMAAGKSTVGKLLAETRGLPFVDLDSRIEERVGKSVAKIFEEDGEEVFREQETLALEELCRGPQSVIATGGGTACFANNLQHMRQGGVVVHLASDGPTSMDRARADATERPLMSSSSGEVEALFRRRRPFYRRAHITISTIGKDGSELSRTIDSYLRRYTISETVSLVACKGSSTPIVVEDDSLDELGAQLLRCLPGTRRALLITDDHVGPLYAERATRSLHAAQIDVSTLEFPHGESSKSLSQFCSLAEKAIESGIDRKTVVVALGGGVVGDLAGYLASSLVRGLSVVQVPTTLLAMTDSSIGGKTGVNSQHGKNLIGAFWQPSLVLIDPQTLRTLPLRERKAAFGELAKYGFLDAAIWDQLVGCAAEISRESLNAGENLSALIHSCARAKAAIVSEDERENGDRVLLNLGHTLGHAIEKQAGYGQVLHGEAVALGLIAACRVSAALGLCSGALERETSELLAKAGLDVDVDRWLTPETLRHIGRDKKRRGNTIRFVVVHDRGDVRAREFEVDELISLLEGKGTGVER